MMMLPILAKNWWLVLLRGLVAVVFGVLAFIWPGKTILALAILYGAYAFSDGVLALAAAVTGKGVVPRLWLAFVGVAGIAAGLVAFFWTAGVALILLLLIGAWAIAHGVMEVIGAIQMRKEIRNEWTLILSGLLSVAFGIFIWVHPKAGALALVWVIGAYAVAFGVLTVAFSFRLKRFHPAIPGEVH